MRKLIIDGNAVYELDEKCMLVRRIDDAEWEKTNRNHLTEETDKVYDNNNLK